MDVEKKIEIAESLAKDLIGVERTEWNKWVEYLKYRKRLEHTLTLAKLLSDSSMLRDRPQRSYRTIFHVMNRRRLQLEQLLMDDLTEILGFVSYILMGRLSKPLKGILKEFDKRKFNSRNYGYKRRPKSSR